MLAAAGLCAAAGPAAAAQPVAQAVSPVTNSDWLTLAGAAVLSALIAVVAYRKRLHVLPREGEAARDVSPCPTPLWFAAAMLMFGATMMTAALLVFFRQAPPSAGATPRDLFIFNAAAQGVGILAGVVLLVQLARRAPRAGMGLSWRGAMLGALAFLAALPFVQAMGVGVRIAQTLASGVTVDPVAHNTLRVLLDDPSDRWGWGLAGIAVLGAPLAEEILFRGFLQSAFRGWLGGPWAAIGCSSLLFTLVHVGDATGMGAPGVAAIFVLSLGLGWSFERSRSIAAPIVMHMLFNAANVAMAVYFAQP